MCQYPWVFWKVLLFIYCVLHELPKRYRQWAGLVANAWLLGPWQLQGPVWRWHRPLLVAGPWEVTVIFRHVWEVPRVLDSGSSRVCAFSGEWEQQQVVLSCSLLLCANLWGDWGHRWYLFPDPLVVVAMPTSGVWDLCCSLPLPPGDHARGPALLFVYLSTSLLPLSCTRCTQTPKAHTGGILFPIAPAGGTSPPVACVRCSPPSESLQSTGTNIPMVPSPTVAPCFSWGPRPPPGFPWLWHSASLPVATTP